MARGFYRHAQDNYEKAYEIAEGDAYYPGINAATLQLLCQDKPDFEPPLLQDVLTSIAEASAKEESMWVIATQAEAELLKKRPDFPEARDKYRRAAMHSTSTPRDRESMFKQIVRILKVRRSLDDWKGEFATALQQEEIRTNEENETAQQEQQNAV